MKSIFTNLLTLVDYKLYTTFQSQIVVTLPYIISLLPVKWQHGHYGQHLFIQLGNMTMCICTGCPQQGFCKGGAAGVASVRWDQGLPHAGHSIPASFNGLTTGHSRGPQPHWWCLWESIFTKGKKMPEREKDRTKRVRNSTGKHQGQRRRRSCSKVWYSLQAMENPCWSRFILKNWSQWRGPTVEQGNSVRRKGQQRGSCCVLTANPLHHWQWDRGLRSEGVNVDRERRVQRLYYWLALFLTIWIYFNWQQNKLFFPKSRLFCPWW